VTGSSNFKLESVISHETSEQHLRSVGKQSAKENSTVNSAAAKIVQSLNKNVLNRMTNLFRNVHALIKKRDVHSQTLYGCVNLMKLKLLTKVRALDVIVPPPIPRLMSIEFQLLVYILIFLRGRNDYE
jgi:acetylglutamate synthase